MATTRKTNADPVVDDVVDVEDQAPEQLPVGTVVRLPNHHDRYAIVVGYTDPVEEHIDHTGGRVEAVPGGHPLLLDLPGMPREHQSGIERV